MPETASASPAVGAGGGESAPSTGASAPATPSTQTGGTSSSPDAAEGTPSDGQQQSAPKQDWKKLAREDLDLKAFIGDEANRIAQRQRDKDRKAELRRLAKEAVDAPDDNDAANKAFEVAKRLNSEPPDPEDAAAADHAQRAQRVAADLEESRTDPDYHALYEREGRAAMDARWQKDPIAFRQWVKAEMKAIGIQTAVDKALKALTKAAETEAQTKLLSTVGVPLSGGGLGGSTRLTPDTYAAMSSAERLALRRTNPAAIDEMMARLT